MTEEMIQSIDEWFESRKSDEYYDRTYHHTEKEDGEDAYVISCTDLRDFTDFLVDEFPDMIGLTCRMSHYGVWFTSKDLENAKWI